MERIDLPEHHQGLDVRGLLPAAWDLSALIDCCSRKPEDVYKRESWCTRFFAPVCGDTLGTSNTLMGHEIAFQIKSARDEGRDIVLIFSVGPMGMYRWAVEFLKRWNVTASTCTGSTWTSGATWTATRCQANNPGALQKRHGDRLLTVPWGS